MPSTYLDVPLEVKEVDALPVAAVQGQNVPGLRVERERHSLLVQTKKPTRSRARGAPTLWTCTHPGDLGAAAQCDHVQEGEDSGRHNARTRTQTHKDGSSESLIAAARIFLYTLIEKLIINA